MIDTFIFSSRAVHWHSKERNKNIHKKNKDINSIRKPRGSTPLNEVEEPHTQSNIL